MRLKDILPELGQNIFEKIQFLFHSLSWPYYSLTAKIFCLYAWNIKGLCWFFPSSTNKQQWIYLSQLTTGSDMTKKTVQHFHDKPGCVVFSFTINLSTMKPARLPADCRSKTGCSLLLLGQNITPHLSPPHTLPLCYPSHLVIQRWKYNKYRANEDKLVDTACNFDNNDEAILLTSTI